MPEFLKVIPHSINDKLLILKQAPEISIRVRHTRSLVLVIIPVYLK